MLLIVRSSPMPRDVDVGGWAVKVWYKGMSPECDICGQGHVAKDCPFRGKCRQCRQPGHISRNCKNVPSVWDPSEPAVFTLASSDPSPAEAAASASGSPGVASSSSAVPVAQMDVDCPVDVVSAPTDAVAPSAGSPEARRFPHLKVFLLI